MNNISVVAQEIVLISCDEIHVYNIIQSIFLLLKWSTGLNIGVIDGDITVAISTALFVVEPYCESNKGL